MSEPLKIDPALRGRIGTKDAEGLESAVRRSEYAIHSERVRQHALDLAAALHQPSNILNAQRNKALESTSETEFHRIAALAQSLDFAIHKPAIGAVRRSARIPGMRLG